MAHIRWGGGKGWLVVTSLCGSTLKSCGSFVLGSVLYDCTSHVSRRIVGWWVWIGLKISCFAPILVIQFKVSKSVFLKFFYVLFCSLIVWWKVNVACVSNKMHLSPLKLKFFTSFPNKKIFSISFLHCISYFGCSKHHVQFFLILHDIIILVCLTIVLPFLCILPLFLKVR